MGLGAGPAAVWHLLHDDRRPAGVVGPAIPLVSCNQPVPLRRPVPHRRPNATDYTRQTGTFYIQDVYAGPGLAGMPRGTAKKLRVIGLDFRATVIGGNHNRGEAGEAFVATPVAVAQGSWEAKTVLGETPDLRRRVGLLHRAGPHAALLPGHRREGPRDSDDAQLDDAPARRKRVLRRLPRAQERDPAGEPRSRKRYVAGPGRWSRSTARRAGSASRGRFSRSSTAIAPAATTTAAASPGWPEREPATRRRMQADDSEVAFSLLGDTTTDRAPNAASATVTWR